MGARPIRGREKMQIMEHIADGQMTLQEIAAKFDRDHGSIRNFASQYAIEIDALRVEGASALKHMWITRKELRLAEAEADYELTQEWLDDLREAVNHKAEEEEKDRPRETRSVALDTANKIVKQRQLIRREAAEECGGLMNRQPNSGPPPPAVQINIEKE